MPPASSSDRPAFLITIDTEGDNLWLRPREITTWNARFLPRFQSLSERYGLQPVYLANYEMAVCPDFQAFARDALARGAAEIGMHLHAWNSPPILPLTGDDFAHQPFLIEYPESAIRQKVAFLTDLLESTFGVKMKSHRAGRWSFNALYARVLVEHGYRVDCSVTPLVSWKQHLGDPRQSGGTDFSAFPALPYRMDPGDIRKPGASGLLEVPMTILSLEPGPVAALQRRLPARSLPSRALRRFFPPAVWLRPNGANRGELLRVLSRALDQRRPCVEFMLHSSEFMPGGSPTFPSEREIERLYEDLEALFESAAARFRGATLSAFAESLVSSTSGEAPSRGVR